MLLESFVSIWTMSYQSLSINYYLDQMSYLITGLLGYLLEWLHVRTMSCPGCCTIKWLVVAYMCCWCRSGTRRAGQNWPSERHCCWTDCSNPLRWRLPQPRSQSSGCYPGPGSFDKAVYSRLQGAVAAPSMLENKLESRGTFI